MKILFRVTQQSEGSMQNLTSAKYRNGNSKINIVCQIVHKTQYKFKDLHLNCPKLNPPVSTQTCGFWFLVS